MSEPGPEPTRGGRHREPSPMYEPNTVPLDQRTVPLDHRSAGPVEPRSGGPVDRTGGTPEGLTPGARPRRWPGPAEDATPTAVLPNIQPDPQSETAVLADPGQATQVLPILDVGDATVGSAQPPGAERTPATEQAATASVARNSGIMALGSLVSRATGFLRTAAIGAAIGGALVGNAYQVANTLPNMLYELLLGGILGSVLVPLLVNARTKDPDGGEAFTHRLLTAAALMLAAATALALLAAPLLTAFFNDGETSAADSRLVTLLAYLLLPEIFFYGIAALLAAVLNTRGHFAAPMWAPILNNITVIATAVTFLALPGPARLTPESITGAQVAVLGIGTTLGIVLQAASLWPALRKVGFRWRWRFDLRGHGLGEAVRLGSWMLVYVGVSQLGLLPVIKIAAYAGHHGGPGPAIHNAAFLLFMMVHGIVAVSILTALLPRMSAAASAGRFADVTRNLSLGARLSSVVLVPATVAYFVLGVPLAVTAFQWGEFSHAEAVSTGYATMAAAVGLVPFALSQMQIFAFYAMRDTKTPALLNIPVVVIKIAFDLGVLALLPAEYVVVGLQFGNTVSYVVAVIVSGRLLKRRLGSLDGGRITKSLLGMSAAAAVAGLAGWGALVGIQSVLGSAKFGSLVALAVGGVVLIAVFAVIAVRLKVSEVLEVWATVRSRLPSRASN